MITEYIAGYLITQTIILIWFYSPLRITIGQLFIDKTIYMTDHFETHLLMISPFLGKLLSCYICFSFWTSIIIGAAGLFICYDVPLYAPLLTGFTYPCICYLYKSIVDKS